jgi:hypothetical protein
MRKLIALAALATTLPATAVAGNDWQFALTPYLWLAGVDGDTATIPPLPEVPIDISPSDAIEDTETGYMLIFEAKKGRHGLLVDFFYTDLRSDEDLVKELNLKLRATSKNTLLSLAYLYELYNDNGTTVDVSAGARYWDVETILKFSGGEGLLAGRSIDNAEDWIDPMVGVKGRTPLGDTGFYFAGWASLGGFGVNSDLFWDVSLNLGYQWNDAIGTTLGYRVLDVDYDDDGFIYDVEQYGFALGLTWRF